MSDASWIEAALTAARPRATCALLRYFRNLDTAEEAFQEACLRALRTWPVNGPPRDPTAWLILVGRNAGLDNARRRERLEPLPPDEAISDLGDPRLHSQTGSTSRTTVTTFCACCSFAAIRTCQRPSRSRWRCASFLVCLFLGSHVLS